MQRHTNSTEHRFFTRRHLTEARLARWHGRQAFIEGHERNPHHGWTDCHSHQCLLWCWWLQGWLLEFHRAEDQEK